MNELSLWSLRNSIAYGEHFKRERYCSKKTAQEWLDIYSKDEPNVLFVISAKKPMLSVKSILLNNHLIIEE